MSIGVADVIACQQAFITNVANACHGPTSFKRKAMPSFEFNGCILSYNEYKMQAIYYTISRRCHLCGGKSL